MGRLPANSDFYKNDQIFRRKAEMKKNLILTFAFSVVTLLGGMPATAQDMGLSAKFTMATAFYVGGAKMPPGTYTIRQSQDDPSIYVVTNSSGTHTVDVLTSQSSQASKSGVEMVFHKYGTGEYLVGVLTATGTSINLDPGVAEKLAAKKGSPQTHSVPAK